MKVALDCNWYSDYFRGVPLAVEEIQSAERIYLPFIVLGELRAGFAGGTQSRQNEKGLCAFLSSPRVRLLFADEQTTFQYAQLYDQLKKQGTPIPSNDIWIAALVIQHKLKLLSHDGHFDHLPQLHRG